MREQEPIFPYLNNQITLAASFQVQCVGIRPLWYLHESHHNLELQKDSKNNNNNSISVRGRTILPDW